MLEILAIMHFCRLVGKTLRQASVRPMGFQLLTIALWFGGELVGMTTGYLIFRSPRTLDFPISAYIFGIVGAFGGAIAAVYIAGRKAARATPDPTKCASCSYSRAGLSPGAPCPECGKVPLPQ